MQKSDNSSAEIQFLKGINEIVIPEIRLTRSKDGKPGRAIFTFSKPQVLQSEDYKKIQGMLLIDQEGELTTREVNISVINGEKTSIKATYAWKSEVDFQRFMRFAQRYAADHGLGYSEKKE